MVSRLCSAGRPFSLCDPCFAFYYPSAEHRRHHLFTPPWKTAEQRCQLRSLVWFTYAGKLDRPSGSVTQALSILTADMDAQEPRLCAHFLEILLDSRMPLESKIQLPPMPKRERVPRGIKALSSLRLKTSLRGCPTLSRSRVDFTGIPKPSAAPCGC